MRLDVDRLKSVITVLLKKLGAEELEARKTASILVMADMRGIPTHGCAFVPLIAERIDHGVLTIPTHIEKLVDEEAITHLDGHNGLGQIAAEEAMRICIRKARHHGLSLTLIRNTNHIGMLGYYSMTAAAEDMIGVCMTNAAPAMAPWGGTEPYMGTNPISVAAPIDGEEPVVLDMSASVTARGKIRLAQRLNKEIPLDWALDQRGAPTANPTEALNGSLRPIGGAKGYGMALFVDLICGLLSGSRFGRDLSTFHKPQGPTGVGAMVMALDIARFMPVKRFKSLVRDHAEAIRNSPKMEGINAIFLPGETGSTKAADGLSQGVDVDDQVAAKINTLLARNDLSIRLEDRSDPAPLV